MIKNSNVIDHNERKTEVNEADKMKSVYDILGETIDNMPELTLNEVYNAYEGDFGTLIKDISQEAYRILNDGKKGEAGYKVLSGCECQFR